MCNKSKVTREHSFYYWRTTLDNDAENAQQIRQLGVDHFYIHYMDIGWSENLGIPVPQGELSLYYPDSMIYTAKTYTPVVFITNRTFEHMPAVWTDTLAYRLTNRIAQITKHVEELTVEKEAGKYYIAVNDRQDYHVAERMRDSIKKTVAAERTLRRATAEIQIDCDWTEGTRDKYFSFLKKMKALNGGKTISATIRLYPYKYYKKMGVPPVDRGMLMCYNLGNINDARTTNSIFDIKEMNQYLNGADYPLPLDIALPIFSWQAWFRGGAFKGIVHKEIALDTNTFKKLGNNTYRINTDTVIDDTYYRKGDELRVEAAPQDDLVKAADKITGKLPTCRRITFFDWNKSSIIKYEQAIRAIYTHY